MAAWKRFPGVRNHEMIGIVVFILECLKREALLCKDIFLPSTRKSLFWGSMATTGETGFPAKLLRLYMHTFLIKSRRQD